MYPRIQKPKDILSGGRDIEKCIRDDQVESTSLWREIELCTETSMISGLYDEHKGLHRWAAYRQNIRVFKSLTARINNTLKKYKNRRSEVGLFYLAPKIDSYKFTDSNSEFLRGFWRKKRLEHKMHQGICSVSASVQESAGPSDGGLSSVIVGTLTLCGMRHVFGSIVVISLAWAIVCL